LLCGRVWWCIFCVCVLARICRGLRNQKLGNVPVFVHLKYVFALYYITLENKKSMHAAFFGIKFIFPIWGMNAKNNVPNEKNKMKETTILRQ